MGVGGAGVGVRVRVGVGWVGWGSIRGAANVQCNPKCVM